jgi:hypothetical protein
MIRAVLIAILFYNLIEHTSNLDPATVMLVIASCFMVIIPIMLVRELSLNLKIVPYIV